jgi:hypothetical protein
MKQTIQRSKTYFKGTFDLFDLKLERALILCLIDENAEKSQRESIFSQIERKSGKINLDLEIITFETPLMVRKFLKSLYQIKPNFYSARYKNT